MIKTLLRNVDQVDRQILAAVIERMWPEALTDRELIRILEGTNASKPYSTDYLEHELETLVARIPSVERGVALLEAVALVDEPAAARSGLLPDSKAYGWLIQFVWKLVEYIDAHMGLPEDSPALLGALALCEQADHLARYTGDVHSKAVKFVSGRRSLRHTLFWHCAQMERERSTQPINKFWLVTRSPALGILEDDDAQGFLAAIKERRLFDDKLTALSALTMLYRRSTNGDELLQRIRTAIADDAALEEALAQELKPREPSQAEKDFAKWEQRQAREQRARERKKVAGRQSFIEQVKADPNLVGSLDLARKEGKLWNSTLWLFNEIRQKKPHSSRWTIENWEVLKADYGDEVAERFRNFCISLWRVYQPELRSERKKDTNSTPWITIAGLSGLTIEVANLR